MLPYLVLRFNSTSTHKTPTLAQHTRAHRELSRSFPLAHTCPRIYYLHSGTFTFDRVLAHRHHGEAAHFPHRP